MSRVSYWRSFFYAAVTFRHGKQCGIARNSSTTELKTHVNNTWMEKGICAVSHLIDSNTGIISYENFCVKYNFICNRASFETITKAIPKAVVCQIKEIPSYSVSIIPHLPVLLVEGRDFKGSQLSNKTVRNKFNHISYPLLVYRNSISHSFSKDSIHRLRTEYLKFLLPPKVKEVHFKWHVSIE